MAVRDQFQLYGSRFPYLTAIISISLGAGVPLTTAQLYSGAHTDDLRSTLLYLRDTYPEAPLLGIGFSLGANVLTRYVEEEGELCRFRSATVLGCVSLLPFLQYLFGRQVC